MSDSETTRGIAQPAAGGPTAEHDPVPMAIDWVIGILTGLVGVLLTALGVGLYSQVDRATIVDVVDAEATELQGISRSEFITAAEPFVDWFGVGLAVTGLVAVGAAAVFVYKRQQTRARVTRDGGTTATFWACTVYGAVVTVLVSFIPGSAVAGGGAAAYLHDGTTNTRIGAASGLLGTAFTAPLLAFLAVGFLTGASAIGQSAGGVLLAGVVIGSGVVAIALNAALGALGGYLVSRLR